MTFWSCTSDVPHRLGRVQADGIGTRYLEAGQGDEALLFLHGVNGHLEVFLRNLRAHAADHRVLAMDLVGHGWSDKPLDRPYEIAGYVDHVLGFLDAMGIDRVGLVGTSLGGWISARIAATAPERVRTLTLVSAGGLTTYPHVMASLRDLGTAAARDGRDAVRRRLEFVILDPANVTPELVDLRAAIYAHPDHQAVVSRVMCLQDPQTRARNLLTEAELGRIRCPTLVVWTHHDPTATLADGERYAAAIPGARLEVFDASSHMPQFEEPERFDAVHLDFLARARATTAGTR